MSDFDCDLFVIGAGSGGVRASRVAAGFGAKVMIAEESRVGGTCVIRGCVPKKLFVQAGDFRRAFENAQGFGWQLADYRFDWPTLREAKDREINRLESIYRDNLSKSGVELIAGRARISGANEVEISTGQRLRTRYVLIAVGSRPEVPEFPGSELGVVSDEIFDLKALPRRILIQGGGFIACEFASLLHEMGVTVTQLYRRDVILRGFDQDIRRFVQDAFSRRGVNVVTGQVITSAERTPQGLRVQLSSGEAAETDMLLHATGRAPYTSDLGLENVGLPGHGAIAVDEFSQTSLPWLYAVGDVTNRVTLTPAAIREGSHFAHSVFGDKPRQVDHWLVPSAVFARPEVGIVGLNEETAREQYPDIEVHRTEFRPLAAAVAGSNERVMMKLICLPGNGKILGVHLAGAGAAELVQLVAVAMQAGVSKQDFDDTLPVHPTAAEELVTL